MNILQPRCLSLVQRHIVLRRPPSVGMPRHALRRRMPNIRVSAVAARYLKPSQKRKLFSLHTIKANYIHFQTCEWVTRRSFCGMTFWGNGQWTCWQVFLGESFPHCVVTPLIWSRYGWLSMMGTNRGLSTITSNMCAGLYIPQED